jgi:hypothetical protein
MKRLLAIVCLFFLIIMTYAQENEESNKEESKNELSVFLGGTTNSEASAFTLGMEYQYRLSKVIGLGAFVDIAFGEIKSALAGPAVFLHTWNLEFTIAPAAEFNDKEIIAALRLGTGYRFKIRKFVVMPALFFDTERNKRPSWVYGLNFGYEL